MTQVILNIEDTSKLQAFLEFIKGFEHVNVDQVIEEKTEDDFFALSGMWKDRDIDLQKIREKAWQRNK